ncbi:MAG: hypothetical protein Q9166_006687 [cf. Caloplaca sp. 2 TL-2023]
METERRRPHRRERRRSQRSSQPQQPLDSMAIKQTPESSVPSPDTKTVIARSMSRYKGTRLEPSRSISTPSVPAIPPVQASGGSLTNKKKERPTTTFDRFPRASDTEDEDEDTLVPPIRANSGLQYQPKSPAAQKSGSEYNTETPFLGRSEDHELEVIRSARPHKDSLQRRHPGSSGAHQDGSRHAKTDREDTRRTAFTAGQDSRRNATTLRPAMLQKKSFSQRIAGLMSQPQSAAEAKEQLKSMISNPIAIEPEKFPPTPQFDAPKSAVNAGERAVRVKYKEFQVPVTVIPSTTPAGIIRAVADKVATPIDQDSSVILESFKQLGLERPLRRYEHIRDVLNSWDNDTENTLIIEPSTTEGHDDDLDVRHAPKKQPDDASFYLHHSQRPGNWDKRVVLVRSDGQMLVAKTDGGEFSNICHLSDFDIYIPTARQLAKKIRPPKRICFAIKSQQKSNMFVSTVNFVHFFSSNDKRMARSLYTAVQEWRSWYLVNVMGKGMEQSTQPSRGLHTQHVKALELERKPVNLIQTSPAQEAAQRTRSARSNPSLEAGRRPAMQMAQHSAPQDVHPAFRNNIQKDRNDRQAPPPSLVQKSSAGASADDPFTGSGLLGRTYTQRKNLQQDYEARHSDAPIQIPTSSPSPVKANSNGLKRTSSQRQKPKPLVDLTPVYQEPPQHSRKGKGVTPGQIPAGGLIDIATSPEVAIPIPPKNDWRRPGTNSGADVSPFRCQHY